MLINGFHFIPTVTSNHCPKPCWCLHHPEMQVSFFSQTLSSTKGRCLWFFCLLHSLWRFDFLSLRQPSRVKVVNEPVCFMVCSHPAWLPNCSVWPHFSSEPDGEAEGPSPHTQPWNISWWQILLVIASWNCAQSPESCFPPSMVKIVRWVLCGHWHQEALPPSLGSWQCWVLKAAWCELPRWTVKAVSREKLDFPSRWSLSTFYPGDFSVLSRPSMKVNVFSMSGAFSVCLTFSKSSFCLRAEELIILTAPPCHLEKQKCVQIPQLADKLETISACSSWPLATHILLPFCLFSSFILTRIPRIPNTVFCSVKMTKSSSVHDKHRAHVAFMSLQTATLPQHRASPPALHALAQDSSCQIP